MAGRYRGYSDDDDGWPQYIPVAERRRRAAKKIAKMKKSGRDVSPVEIAGRKIATTFWGDAWCKNLEAYSDYANRLPRGRTYVRNGSVIDLQIAAGRVRALVSGTELYRVDIKIKPLPVKKWTQVKGRCAGRIDSLVELLMGSISKGVMEIVTRKGEGLFPAPREISLDCSCPDWASVCKHVAATLYGVGARLDHEPELLFGLRGVDPSKLVEAAIDQPKGAGKARTGRMARGLDSDALSSVFGVDIDLDTGTDGVSSAEAVTPTRPAKKTRRGEKPRKVTTSRASKKKAGAEKTARKAASRKKAAAGKRTKPTAAKAASKKKNSAKKASPKKVERRRTSTKKAATRKGAVKKAVWKKS